MKFFSLLKQRGIKVLYYKIKHTFFVQDKDIRAIGARNGSYEYLQRYAHICGTSSDKMSHGEKIIWVCWFQGLESAPKIVQKCVESIHKYSGDYKVVEITEENYGQYVQLPDYIIEKYHSGIISRTHFSDLLRFSLLVEYGGIWMDSTILLTGNLPDFVTDVPLFAYRNSQIGSSMLSLNFMSSCKHHPLVEDTMRLLYAYWKRETKMVDYLLAAIFWTISVRANKQNTALWEAVPNVPCALKDILLGELNKPYTEKGWKHICSMSSIHKLTYKFELYGIDPAKKRTFYDVLFNK